MPELTRSDAVEAAGDAAGASGELVLRPRNGVRKFQLQVGKQTPVDVVALGRTLDTTPFPQDPLAAVTSVPAVFWTAPREWLISGAHLDRADCAAMIGAALGEQTHVVTDLSDALVLLELAGARCTELLAATCAVNFDGVACAPGRYALTRMHRLPLLIHRPGAPLRYHLYVERPVARFLADWLHDLLPTLGG